MQEIAKLQETANLYRHLQEIQENLAVTLELFEESQDKELAAELAAGLMHLQKETQKWEETTLFSGPYDQNNAIMSLHAGAGGTEAQDWTEMLMRMYARWAQEHGLKTEILDYLPGDEAGLKSVTMLISGQRAYGYLKAEKGVHRLVRISPFDSSGRRHTSFASVDVIPEVEKELELEINPEELRIDTYRASGHGGQHINKTDSAVRITHMPTGIVVQCQSERSQHANKLRAMKILSSRLLEIKRQEKEKEITLLRGKQQEIAWGSQIRSYIFEPYALVKDHRTDMQIGNVQGVIDGDLDPLIMAYLKQFGQNI